MIVLLLMIGLIATLLQGAGCHAPPAPPAPPDDGGDDGGDDDDCGIPGVCKSTVENTVFAPGYAGQTVAVLIDGHKRGYLVVSEDGYTMVMGAPATIEIDGVTATFSGGYASFKE